MFTDQTFTYGQNIRLLQDFMLRSDGGCTLRYTNVVITVSGQFIRKGGDYGLYLEGEYNRNVVLLADNLSFTQGGFLSWEEGAGERVFHIGCCHSTATIFELFQFV